ncbi:hypothetical protein ORIO_23635 (plasmid) [Cereibacter azotoformans]|uniref:DNA cytosine methyltransferase n=1 Tax=Cereibacter azotoformans TaxID=43057 RepID=A0A2T5JYZ3_9RHOB|nr:MULTISPECIES: hypothetical protein [Cereibacter]AXQ94527.1 hypothetical protein D0Z66_12360 [Cereibacter sphaeroides]MBO4170633.1 hypothetical protein [Cereibacter azotoformans]MWP39605.1 hypothetical protein [Cereibacter sphaeroides]PTR15365.1 hypothetical protein C8J28_11486 [Cereibacter azotoformans]UIJ30082.1 hypothetical protein LV780_12330 [Cereibacter azotoformans]
MAEPLRILIGCETSGVMRRAFAARGHDVWSCDLLAAEDRSNRHIVGDVRDHLTDGWDLLIVAHPPCTRLCNSGVRWLHEPSKRLPETYAAAEREAFARMGREERLAFLWADLDRGAALFAACWQAPAPRVAVENPVMNPHARARLPADLPRPQTVQPWWFGEPFFKATSFYLRGLPRLAATNRLTPPRPGTPEHKSWSAVHRAPPGPDRWKFRSRTFEGVAEACADQWGGWAEGEAAACG